MNKMNNLLKRAAITAAMMAVAVTLPARADHSDSGVELSADGTVVNLECVTFGGLEYTLREYVYFTNEDKDRPALEGKLIEAHDKEHEGKVCDSAQKLEDFSSKIDRLTPDGRKAKAFETHPGALLCLEEGALKLATTVRNGETCADAGDPPRGKGPKNK